VTVVRTIPDAKKVRRYARNGTGQRREALMARTAGAARPHGDLPSGADAGEHGLPRRRDLPLLARLEVDVSAAFDLGLRTATSSLVTATVAPLVLNPRLLKRETRNVEFYAELASRHDADDSFPAPASQPPIRRKRAGPLSFHFDDGQIDLLSFDSPFEARNPAMRDQWRGYRRNAVACAQYWHHRDSPRPTLCVIHGFMGSPYLLNGAFFALPWFYRAGFDVLLYTLPFHGTRQERFSPFSGHGFFAHGLSGAAEAMGQAVHDFRIFVDYLEQQGAEVGVTGMSLGGYTTSLLAALEPRLRVVIPNVPVSDLGRLVPSWAPGGRLIDVATRLGHVDRELLDGCYAYHSGLNYEPVVAKERRLIICGLGDRLAPPEQSELLWEHWDRCKLHWFPGNHILHIDQPTYLRRMARFMRANGFAPADWMDRPHHHGTDDLSADERHDIPA
jgi:pimeloyl-ACP methyl ester carboxylesterase